MSIIRSFTDCYLKKGTQDMTKKKVLWLIKGLGMGGAERLLSSAIPYFDRNVYDYEVAYCVPSKNDLVPELERAQIPVFCLNLKNSFDPRVAFKLGQLLRERKPDILHVHLPYTGVMGRVVGRLTGIKGIVYTEHNVMEMYHPLTRALNLMTYSMSNTNIFVSEEVRRSVIKHRIVNRNKVLVIRNGVALNSGNGPSKPLDEIKKSLGVPKDHLVVGNVAHIRPEKGHEYLIQAAKYVIDQRPRTTFVVVGREKETGDINRLEGLAKELGIHKNIVFTGFREDVYDLMRIFDIFILSSLHEGLPIALLEAMSLGRPAVATSVGGVPEVIKDGYNGFLVPAKNPKALGEGILKILQNDSLRQTMSQKAQQTTQNEFSIQSMVGKVEQVYSSILSN
jgi:L-malate glycosyltransferase